MQGRWGIVPYVSVVHNGILGTHHIGQLHSQGGGGGANINIILKNIFPDLLFRVGQFFPWCLCFRLIFEIFLNFDFVKF